MGSLSRILATCGASIVLSGPVMAGVEETVALDAVPSMVVEIAEENFAKLRLATDESVDLDDDTVLGDGMTATYVELGAVEIVSANTETEDDGSFVYEIQGVLADSRKVEVDIFPNGRVAEIELEFMRDDVPGAILNAVEAEMPGFAPDFIEASHSASMQVIGYEFSGLMGTETLDIEVSADGRNITLGDE